jgi:hypothetical protein
MKISEHAQHFYSWDDMTYVLGNCVIQREPAALHPSHYVAAVIHECSFHPPTWIEWPPYIWRCSSPSGPQAILPSCFDRDETSELIP